MHSGSCPVVKNILLLDSERKRVAVKYYCDDWPTHSAKLAFEKSIFTKIQRTNARTEGTGTHPFGFSLIFMADRFICFWKQCLAITLLSISLYKIFTFFVTGGDDENELILATVLQGFYDAVTLLLRSNVEQREALENLNLILLCLDEIVDGGMILETDGSVIAGKVASHNMDDRSPISEQVTCWLDNGSRHLLH
ncbi:hypothetical protein K7X08_013565 [Anisodus acutangulus]|uniref:Coatomer subunit zeta n=1 Tax=Anisodus acutangulus TaxID=402998 RepID=A0A9Q1LLS4_9SOLA|nr:hypothetical protein K7X08_013565 [Anisodus acutangulus]